MWEYALGAYACPAKYNRPQSQRETKRHLGNHMFLPYMGRSSQIYTARDSVTPSKHIFSMKIWQKIKNKIKHMRNYSEKSKQSSSQPFCLNLRNIAILAMSHCHAEFWSVSFTRVLAKQIFSSVSKMLCLKYQSISEWILLKFCLLP